MTRRLTRRARGAQPDGLTGDLFAGLDDEAAGMKSLPRDEAPGVGDEADPDRPACTVRNVVTGTVPDTGTDAAPGRLAQAVRDVTHDVAVIDGPDAGRHAGQMLPRTPARMLALLDEWQAQGMRRDIDVALARFLAQEVLLRNARVQAGEVHSTAAAAGRQGLPLAGLRPQGEADGVDGTDGSVPEGGHDGAEGAVLDPEAAGALALVLLGAALCSAQLGQGHACLDLQAVTADPAGIPGLPVADALHGLDALRWQAALRAWPQLVSCPAQAEDACAGRFTPLVLAHGRLYLHRLWRCEQDVQQGILQRLGRDDAAVAGAMDAQRAAAAANGADAIDDAQTARLQQALDVLFPSALTAGAQADTGVPADAGETRQRTSPPTGRRSPACWLRASASG